MTHSRDPREYVEAVTQHAGESHQPDGYGEQQALTRARRMHALVGNTRKKQGSRKKRGVVRFVKKASSKKKRRSRKKKITTAVIRDTLRGYGQPNPAYQPTRAEIRAAERPRNGDQQFMDVMQGAVKTVGDMLIPGLGTIGSNVLGTIVGMGDYSEVDPPYDIDSNSLMGRMTPEARQVPMMHSDGTRVRIQHREYLGDIAMTQDFSLTSIRIDPTNPMSFPWLSSQVGYQQYRFLGLIYEIKSLSANAISGTVAGMGSITASVRYDAYSEAPTSKSEIANSLFSVSCKPSEHMMIPVECDPSQTLPGPLKVLQVGQQPPDLQFYVTGILDIATQGAPNYYTGAAELWVTYDIVFFKPRLTGITDGGLVYAMDLSNPLPAQPFAPNSGRSQPYINSLGAELSPMGDVIVLPYTLPAGTLLSAVYFVQGPDASGLQAPLPTYTGGLELANVLTDNFGLNDTSSFSYPASTTASLQLFCVFYFRYDGTGSILYPPTLGMTLDGVVYPTESAGSFIINIVNNLADMEAVNERARRKKLTGGACRHYQGGRTVTIHGQPEEKRDERKVRPTTVPVPEYPKTPVHSDDEWIDRAAPREAVTGAEERAAVVRNRTMHSLKGNTTLPQSGPTEAQEQAPGLRDPALSVGARQSKWTVAQTINRPGLRIAGGPVRAAMQERANQGWLHPNRMLIGLGGTEWFWADPVPNLEKRLMAEEPKGVWTLDKIRRAMCWCRSGQYCNHTILECPMVDQSRGAQDRGDGKEAIGSIGSGSHKGDGPGDFYNFCGSKNCARVTHVHKARPTKPAKPGAAERKAKKKRITAEGFALCATNGVANTMATCPVADEAHYHRWRSTKGVATCIEGAEDVEAFARESAELERDGKKEAAIKKDAEREKLEELDAQLPPSGECSIGDDFDAFRCEGDHKEGREAKVQDEEKKVVHRSLKLIMEELSAAEAVMLFLKGAYADPGARELAAIDLATVHFETLKAEWDYEMSLRPDRVNDPVDVLPPSEQPPRVRPAAAAARAARALVAGRPAGPGQPPRDPPPQNQRAPARQPANAPPAQPPPAGPEPPPPPGPCNWQNLLPRQPPPGPAAW